MPRWRRSPVLPGTCWTAWSPRSGGARYDRPVRLGKNPTPAECTTFRESARSVGFTPRELRDLQLRVRIELQTPEWKTRYAVRSGVEGTVNEFAHGHGMRRCRYRGQDRAHVQHVLTAIARQHRAPQRPATHRSRASAPTPDCPPEFPRPARHPPAEVLEKFQRLTPPAPRSPSESS
ncbi:transposase [Streptomyces mirabilis]